MKKSKKKQTEKGASALIEKNVFPFTIEFEEQSFPDKTPLPCLQSYAATISRDGYILALAGRLQGLHTFKGAPAHNFQKALSNHNIYVIDPRTGDFWTFDTQQLDEKYSGPLKATNLQAYHDRDSDQMYIVGGYGWTGDGKSMKSFNTLIAFQVEELVTAIKQSQPVENIASLFNISYDDRFAIAGGELFFFDNAFYLVFGQKFMGQYRAFGGTDFQQTYSEEIRIFTLDPKTLEILSYGENTNTEADHPFHRRDGNIIEDIDPGTGMPRMSAFGGVFPPGVIGAYTYPIYINGPKPPVIDRSFNQKFSQYECPIISIFDTSEPTIYHTFFGGIGHYYYFQTEDQKRVFQLATSQGRNDGLPFLGDITTVSQTADNTYKELIHTEPIPGNRLLGTSIQFLVNPAVIEQGLAYENGVVDLQKISADTRQLVGYIYGGIEAKDPFPEIPNEGTKASNSLFAVYVTRKPSNGIPASEAHNSGVN